MIIKHTNLSQVMNLVAPLLEEYWLFSGIVTHKFKFPYKAGNIHFLYAHFCLLLLLCDILLITKEKKIHSVVTYVVCFYVDFYLTGPVSKK